MFGTKPFLSKADKARLSQAITAAEEQTTGEIVVHIAALPAAHDALEAAKRLLVSLGLDRTAARNAVLILISPSDRRFAIWGDAGIHAKAGQQLWDHACAIIHAHFEDGRYADGLCAGVQSVGQALALHFPSQRGGEPNELSDEVSET